MQEDLAEVLEGLDPMELLIQDPTLAEVAEELMIKGIESAVFGEGSSDGSSMCTLSNLEQSAGSTDNTESGIELATGSNSSAIVKTNTKSSCEVCGRPAEKHLNYGAMTCNSCRAFFTRSSKNNAYENFVCVNAHINNSDICKIDSASWKSCKKCRFKRCQQLGMKLKLKSLYESCGSSSPYPDKEHLRMALTLTDKLTNDDRAYIRSMVIKRLDCKMENRGRFFMRDPEHLRMHLNQTYHGQAMTLKDFKLYEDFFVYGQIQTFSEGEFIADGMTKKDRVRLLSANYPLAMEFFEAYRIEMEKWKNYDPFKDMENLLKNLDLKDKNEYYNVYKDVSQGGSLKPQKVGYDGTYNHQELDILIEEEVQRHKKAVKKVVSLSLNEPDPVLPMLISSLIIYSTDSVELDNPGSAEQVQLSFASLLHR